MPSRVTFADAAERTLVAIADDLAAAVTAKAPDIAVAFAIATRPGGRFLAVLASGPAGEVAIGAHGADWVEFNATSSIDNRLVFVGDGDLTTLVDLTVEWLTGAVLA